MQVCQLSHFAVVDLPISNMQFLEATCPGNQFSEIKMIEKRSVLSSVTPAKISENIQNHAEYEPAGPGLIGKTPPF